MRHTREERLAFARSNVAIRPNDFIDPSANIWYDTLIGANGFGYVRDDDGSLVEMPHMGSVHIQKNVVVKSFCTIDRAVQGETFIGEGTKIDHHCHIAHGAKIGKYNTLANGCIIEGSCEIGDFNTFGAGVIVQTKVKIGNNNIFGSGCVVTKDVGDNCVMVGNPARKLRDV